ncbi:MAG: DUF2505 domain-containing protein [Propionibacteriaceae bacterium]|jgi:hypothetical protein|nr:DUF2505 domain-containing protein [Propionibacteriaceae bacterium]
MAMDIEATLHFEAPAATISKMLIAPDFQEMIGERIKATECSTVVGVDEITATYRIPTIAAYRAYAGAQMKLIGRLRWTAPLLDGRQLGELELVTEHFPATTCGTVKLCEKNGGTEVVYDCQVKARIPFLSGKLEKLIGGAGQTMVEVNQQLGETWLQRHAADPAA